MLQILLQKRVWQKLPEKLPKVKEKVRFPATKLLLFTGFDDFEYAKEAVHLEIEEYILKPLNLAEITEVFKKA